MKRRSLYALGTCCFLSHFFLEVVSFFILTRYADSPVMWTLALLYDFYAFVPQGIYGALRDRFFPRIDFARIGAALLAAALVLMQLSVSPYAVIAVLSVGNGMLHIHGAEETLRRSPGRLTPSAVFVAGGSFGLVTGRLLAATEISAWWLLAAVALTVLPTEAAKRLSPPALPENLLQYRCANRTLPGWLLIALSVLVVSMRSYMGYGVPTAWNKTVPQTVALFACLGAGKALGGVMADRIGLRKTVLLSTLGALPFLLFGNRNMPLSLIGLLLFSMTMAVTLGLLVSVLPDRPGVAFGFTTLGLAIGTFPVFFGRIESFAVNCVIVAALSVISFWILWIICAKERMNNV